MVPLERNINGRTVGNSLCSDFGSSYAFDILTAEILFRNRLCGSGEEIIMRSKQKISLAIPAFLMAMVGDYLIGYEPRDIEPLGLIADTGWLTIADWRIALSNLLGAIAVPLYFVAAEEFLRLLEMRNPKGEDKWKDRFLRLFRIGNYAGFFSFVFIHIACGLLILQFNAAYDVLGNADTAMGLDLRIFWAEAIPFLVYFVVADLFTTIGWIGLVVKKAIPCSKAWLLAAPLVTALIGMIFSALQIGFKGIDSGFESLGWCLMFVAAVKYSDVLQIKDRTNEPI